ncbi:C2 domain [Sesbania bispinosa]|nr:C2 domain [Sesbania bispinosa]
MWGTWVPVNTPLMKASVTVTFITNFDGQRRRTTTKSRDLNPQLDEKLEFVVHDKDSMASEMLEVNLYNDKKTGKRSTFREDIWKHIRGELGLKVCYVEEDPLATEAAGKEKKEDKEKPPESAQDGKKKEYKAPEEKKEEEKKEDENKPKEDAKEGCRLSSPPSRT